MTNLLSDLSSLVLFLAAEESHRMRTEGREAKEPAHRMVLQENLKELMSMIEHVRQSRLKVWNKLKGLNSDEDDNIKGGEGTD